MVEVAALAASWLTPTSLFILLNIVIATILISSSYNNNRNNSRRTDGNDTLSPPHHQQLARAPSLFTRVASFNLSSHYQHHYDQPDHNAPTPSLLSRVASFCRSAEPEPVQPEAAREPREAPPVVRSPSLLSRVSSFGLHRAAQPEPARPVTVTQQPQPEATRRSRAEGKAGSHEVEEAKPAVKVVRKKQKQQQQQQQQVGKGGAATTSFRAEEVDAKADDFINKFKQQLKLQRIESLLRYGSPASGN